MAAQSERILVAGRHQADAVDADQGIQLVGQRRRRADVVLRQRIAGEARPVMLLDGARHFLALAVMQGIVLAHDALQLGELAHHVGEQVGLGQMRGALGQLGAGVEVAGDLAGQLGDALSPFELGAELVVVDHAAQFFHARSQGLLAVLVEEELGVRQARAHHPLVAADHRARVGRADVGHDQELVGQLAGLIQQREIFLVRLHGQDQAFLRHAEKLLAETADQHVGALHQAGDLVQQGIVLHRLHPAADFRRCGMELARDVGAARLEAGDHRALAFHLCRIAVGILEADRADGGFETVALGGTAGGQAEHAHRHHLGAMQRDQAMHRAHEVDGAPAGCSQFSCSW